MRTVLNLLWVVFAGVWLAIEYLIAGVVMILTVIGIPFGLQSFKLAGYALWPFGRMLLPAPGRRKKMSVVGNLLWFLLAGWWLALSHLLFGCLLCLTIIGIPLGVGSFKMAGAAFAPFGKEVVRKSDLVKSMPGAVAL